MDTIYIVFGLTSADLATHNKRIISVFKTKELAQGAAQEYYKDSMWQKIEVEAWEIRESI